MKRRSARGLPTASVSLPREPTRGLIEARLVGPRNQQGTTDFPENQLGASLKRRVAGPGCRDIHLLPREPTRGLIEAANLTAIQREERPHFPENQLGASLKPARTALGVSQPRPLPREPTRGLIEASNACVTILTNCYFPENQLGASLKPPRSGHGPCPWRHFPENQLGASLKLGVLPFENPPLFTSPRTNSGPHCSAKSSKML